jgi:hypothetical protein
MHIDVEDADGNRFGSGPITSAMRWRQVKRLKRAGEFAFAMPAADPQAALLQYRRRVRCWDWDPFANKLIDCGSGVIERIRTSVDNTGMAMVEVAGGDLTRELADRIVGNLALMVESSPSPTQVRREIASPPSGTTLTNAYDGNLATSDNVTLTGSSGAPNDWIYVKHSDAYGAVYWALGANVNGVAAELKGQFKITDDGTAVGGATLAQSGLVTFDMPKGWGLFGGEYIIRFYVTANLNDVDFAEVTVRVYTETTTALATLMTYAPAGWSLDALLGYTATANGVYLTFSGESLLTAFVRVAEHTGENFTTGFGRNLIWLQDD